MQRSWKHERCSWTSRWTSWDHSSIQRSERLRSRMTMVSHVWLTVCSRWRKIWATSTRNTQQTALPPLQQVTPPPMSGSVLDKAVVKRTSTRQHSWITTSCPITSLVSLRARNYSPNTSITPNCRSWCSIRQIVNLASSALAAIPAEFHHRQRTLSWPAWNLLTAQTHKWWILPASRALTRHRVIWPCNINRLNNCSSYNSCRTCRGRWYPRPRSI